jgi:hypothetical protein
MLLSYYKKLCLIIMHKLQIQVHSLWIQCLVKNINYEYCKEINQAKTHWVLDIQ